MDRRCLEIIYQFKRTPRIESEGAFEIEESPKEKPSTHRRRSSILKAISKENL